MAVLEAFRRVQLLTHGKCLPEVGPRLCRSSSAPDGWNSATVVLIIIGPRWLELGVPGGAIGEDLPGVVDGDGGQIIVTAGRAQVGELTVVVKKGST
jgi:hypothetical protein